MVNYHSYSFFGKMSAIIFQSSSREQQFIFFQCIKKKANSTWEKPTLGEGKKIKLNLEEIIMILEVLNENLNSWNTFHSYREEKTIIEFNWVKKEDRFLQIKIGNYLKKLSWAQTKIFAKLLTHVLKEKIIFATSKSPTKPKTTEINKITSINTEITEKKEHISDNAVSKVDGRVKEETDKALLIEFGSGVESWIPKSRIHSTTDINQEMKAFEIENWILQKNRIST